MLYALLAAVLVVVDQLVKHWVLNTIPLGGHVPFIPHIVELTYVQNTGAAFSMFSKYTWMLTVISLVMSVVLAAALWKNFFRHPLGKLPITLLLAGAVGNLIDRVARGFVVDFIDVRLINFYVFNIADSFFDCDNPAIFDSDLDTVLVCLCCGAKTGSIQCGDSFGSAHCIHFIVHICRTVNLDMVLR